MRRLVRKQGFAPELAVTDKPAEGEGQRVRT